MWGRIQSSYYYNLQSKNNCSIYIFISRVLLLPYIRLFVLQLLRRSIMSHIAVERNRRRQMNEHLQVLRSLTPCFYIKRVFSYHLINVRLWLALNNLLKSYKCNLTHSINNLWMNTWFVTSYLNIDV